MSDRKEKRERERVSRDIEKEPVRSCSRSNQQCFVFFFLLPVSHLGSQLPSGSDDYRAAEQAAALPAQQHEHGRTPGG